MKYKIKKNIMSFNDSIFKAIKKIQKLKYKIILVEKKNKLVGTITDGDLRKVLFLNKKNIKLKNIMEKRPKVILNGKPNFDEKKIYKINYIPILDKNKNIINIVNITKKNIKFENEVVIFAGGFGTRLYPYTKKVPKPMLKIKNKPHLETLIKKIKLLGFINITISLYHKNKYIKKNLNVKNIKFFTEKKPLGTAGCLRKIKYKNNLPILALNADLITKLDLKNLVNYHISNKSDFTVSVKDRDFEIPFATVEIKNNKILSLEEKPKKSFLFNAGIYMINQDLLKNLKNVRRKIDMTDFIDLIIKKRFKVIPFFHHEKWIDYGTIEQYLNVR